MATSYTSLLGFALPVQGELSGTWGDVVNDSITQLVEDSVAGSATADVTSGNWTLTTTGSGAANEARCAILIPTGTPGTSRNIVAPSQSKAYVVSNQSDAAVVLKGSATTGVTIPTGKTILAAWDGSDFVQVGDNIDLASQVTGTLPVANGGTGATTLTSNNVILGNGTSAVQFVAPGSSGNVLKSNGTTWASAAEDYPGAGIAVSTGSAWTTSKTSPSGDIVGTTDAQTLTYKTVTAPRETCTVSATAATGTINYDVITQSVLVYTSNASANWVVNIRGDGSTTLNSLLSTGTSVTIAFLVPQGATAYYNTSVQIDGTTSGVTTKWQGAVPVSGNASGIDVYVYTVIKTASATYTVLASQTRFV